MFIYARSGQSDLVPIYTITNTQHINTGEECRSDFRMRVRMTQLPRLLFPASAEFRNFALKVQAHWPEFGQLEATEWNCYLRTTLLCFTSVLSWWILTVLSRSAKSLFIIISCLCLLYFACCAEHEKIVKSKLSAWLLSLHARASGTQFIRSSLFTNWDIQLNNW